MDDLIEVKPSKKFLDAGGAGSITAICGKENNVLFRNGEAIEVTPEQKATLSKLKWIEEEVSDGC